MSPKPTTPSENPDEPRPPGEVERDNDALRPTDPTRRKESGKGTESGESTAQETADTPRAAKMKDLNVEQSDVVTCTDVLKVTSQHPS